MGEPIHDNSGDKAFSALVFYSYDSNMRFCFNEFDLFIKWIKKEMDFGCFTFYILFMYFSKGF